MIPITVPYRTNHTYNSMKTRIADILQVSEYASICSKACITLSRLFALALGLPMEYFEQPGFFDNPTCLLGMNSYHFPHSEIWRNEEDPYGIKPHMDSGTHTLLDL